MKLNILIKALILFAMVAVCSCDEQLDSEGVSKTTYYAIITLEGDQWTQVTQGDSWTDPGGSATEDGADVLLTVEGADAVDTNTPGVYVITYTAINKDGFPSTQYRYVGVISPDVIGTDLTGKYKRNAGAGGISTVTQIEANLYTSDNVGGIATPGPATTVHFYHFAPGLLGVPYQLVNGSPFYCTDATVDEGVSYSWVVINGGYGNALRTFVKQ